MKAETNNKQPGDISRRAYALGATLLILASVFSVVALVFWAIIPHLQTVRFLNKGSDAFNGKGSSEFLADNFIWTPNTYAQGIMRGAYLSDVFGMYNKGGITGPEPLLDDAIVKMDEYIANNPSRYDYYLGLAKANDTQAALHNDRAYLKVAERYYLGALAVIEGRQDVIYPYSINLINQGRGAEAVALVQKSIDLNPDAVEMHYRLGQAYAIMGKQEYGKALKELEYALGRNFNPDPVLVKQMYQKFLRYYYAGNDLERFTTVVRRLSNIDTSQGEGYAQVLGYIADNGKIPTLNIVDSTH